MQWGSAIATNLTSSAAVSHREAKQQVAAELAQRVHDGDVIGVGSGSTSMLAIEAIGARIRAERMHCLAIPTSAEATLACAAAGLTTTTLLAARPDWCFDGADEVDPARNLIKGRGGAMFREKLVMRASPKAYILVDRSKSVEKLGTHFPVPVEVNPEALHLAEAALLDLGAAVIVLRLAKHKDGPVITEYGNVILDARFTDIGLDLEKSIKQIPGVIESGLFIGYHPEVLIAST